MPRNRFSVHFLPELYCKEERRSIFQAPFPETCSHTDSIHGVPTSAIHREFTARYRNPRQGGGETGSQGKTFSSSLTVAPRSDVANHKVGFLLNVPFHRLQLVHHAGDEVAGVAYHGNLCPRSRHDVAQCPARFLSRRFYPRIHHLSSKEFDMMALHFPSM